MNWEYCKEILPKVSRTFALNIGYLEKDVYKAVLLGYLFFRIADTFEDNIYQTESEKIKTLNNFSEIFIGNKELSQRLKLYESIILKSEEESSYKNLVENGDRVFKCYFELPEVYRIIMDPLIVKTSNGMAEFQKRKIESKAKIFQLQDIKDLENYCYYVAGIVGVMLTNIFCQQENITELKSELQKYQVNFGLALQWTNIIKDYQKDIKRGWSYIPASVTEKYGIKVEKMDKLSIRQRRCILKEIIPEILNYFDSALAYINILPYTEISIRMFCIIPFVIAYNTLFHIVMMKGDKISRKQVTAILQDANCYANSNSLLEKDYLRIKNIILLRSKAIKV